MWKLMPTNPNIPDSIQCVIRQTDTGFEVRSVSDNEYLKWLSEGNQPLPAEEQGA